MNGLRHWEVARTHRIVGIEHINHLLFFVGIVVLVNARFCSRSAGFGGTSYWLIPSPVLFERRSR